MTNISCLELNYRTERVLLKNGVSTVEELHILSDRDLMKMKEFGTQSLIDLYRRGGRRRQYFVESGEL